MIGLGLAALSALLEEAADSIGKYRIAHRTLNIYAFGFLLNLGGLLTIAAFGLFVPTDFFASGFPGGFVFSAASLPTLSLRIALELLQVYVTVHAIARADRGTFGFLRTLTLPLLLAVDIALGYDVTGWQMAGVATIVGSLLLLFLNHGLSKPGSLFTLVAAVNAVATLSLFKYDVTYFNSVEMEQVIVSTATTVFLLGLALAARQNPIALLKQPIYLLQILLSGGAATFMSFAYLFAPASVITAGRRSLAVLWAVTSGKLYFRETHIVLKLICFALVCAGVIMLAL